jgi:hypothetical protein
VTVHTESHHHLSSAIRTDMEGHIFIWFLLSTRERGVEPYTTPASGTAKAHRKNFESPHTAMVEHPVAKPMAGTTTIASGKPKRHFDPSCRCNSARKK